MDLADRPPPPQVAEISSYSANQEITRICADFLVELRGIEPMAIAAWRLGIEGFPTEFQRCLRGGTQALTICRYLPVNLRFHSLPARKRAMVVACSG
jgi:hypothetical protein